MSKKVVAVFGYNNTRIYDLIGIRNLVQSKLGAEVLLVKEGISAEDREVVQYCFDARLEDIYIAEPLNVFLKTENLKLIGCLPFSDKGVIGASYVAKHFGLVGDDCETAFAMLDKTLFRKLESNLKLDSKTYKKPFFMIAHTKEEVIRLFNSRGPFFIKPAAEGNSRGCMKINTKSDLDKWFIENPTVLKLGAICEEILSDTNEYSFDGVDECYWITEKFTTPGSYRAEYQHIVPAPFNIDHSTLHKTLRPLLKDLGSNGGAFHHEFFILNDDRIASVEPNRRPAGMWIWDLANWAFEDFNPWERWIDWCVGKKYKNNVLNQKSFAGVRGIIANKNGIIHSIDRQSIEDALNTKFEKQNVRISFLKDIGSTVRSEPRDNSDFLAFIALKHENYDSLLANLSVAENMILERLEIRC